MSDTRVHDDGYRLFMNDDVIIWQTWGKVWLTKSRTATRLYLHMYLMYSLKVCYGEGAKRDKCPYRMAMKNKGDRRGREGEVKLARLIRSTPYSPLTPICLRSLPLPMTQCPHRWLDPLLRHCLYMYFIIYSSWKKDTLVKMSSLWLEVWFECPVILERVRFVNIENVLNMIVLVIFKTRYHRPPPPCTKARNTDNDI